MYTYRERLSGGMVQIEPEWGGWYSVSDANADRLRQAAALGNAGMTQFFAVIDADKVISTFSVRDPDTGNLTPWQPVPPPIPPPEDSAKAAEDLIAQTKPPTVPPYYGYIYGTSVWTRSGWIPDLVDQIKRYISGGATFSGSKDTLVGLFGLTEGEITGYLGIALPVTGTPAGTATATVGVGGMQSAPTVNPQPTPGTPPPGGPSVAEVKTGPANMVDQTPFGGFDLSSFLGGEKSSTMLWVVVGVLVAFLVLRRK